MSVTISFYIGWGLILIGVLYGAILGLFFHNEEWLGGYQSYKRRLLRLAHIACFGMGFINIFCGLTIASLEPNLNYSEISVLCLGIAGVLMPVICTLAAFIQSARHAFPIPVFATLIGVFSLILAF